MADPQRDWMTRDGAAAQARQIREFWWRKGYHGVEVRVAVMAHLRGDPIHVVRSNIVDGVPPR